MKQEFTALDNLGFKVENGLCFNIDEAENNAERLYMDEAEKLGATAVFFRRFYKNEGTKPHHSEPVVCIFHKTDNFFNSQPHKELHAALWSAGRTEVYIIQTSTRIDIINARKPAKRVGEKEITIDDKELLLVSNAVLKEFNDRKFSAHLFGSGTFWEQKEFKEELDADNSPYFFLLDYLMEVRERLNNSSEIKLDATTLDKLLILSILIKFLEGIKDDNGRHTLRQIYKKYNILSFAEALEKKLEFDIIDELKNEFNGKIFDQFSDTDKNNIKKANLALISQFLNANIELDTNQFFLWEQYNFQYLPAEVISSIYENFIQADAARTGNSEKGVVYTPIHLVTLLVDEVMPLDTPELFKNEQFRVLDPACGSGVFLVAAYKRMLQWWTINNSKNGVTKYPNKEVAQRILEANIFGVDIEETAVLVSMFGLTIALLDKLTPKEIWDNLTFKNLSEDNIKFTPFTKWAEKNSEKSSFELVIGNPPFNPSSKGTITNKDLRDLFKTQVPGNKLALKFLEAGLFYGKKVCMIIPSSVFLYNKAKTNQEYRTKIFTNNTIKKIFDFTHLRETLFVKKKSKGIKSQKKTGRTPVVALVIDKKPSEYQSIEHIIVKREKFSEKKIRFEIDYYDKHQVRWDWATNEKMQFVWKTNLLGGGRLFHLIYRLSLLENLDSYIKSNNKWKAVRGFEGGRKIIISNKDRIIGIEEDGQPIIIKNVNIETNNLKEDFIYKPPYIIIDQIIGENSLHASFINEDQALTSKKLLYYNRDFIGISTDKKGESALKNIFDLIKNKRTKNYLNYQLFILAISSSCLILTETDVNKSEILAIPYPNNQKYLKLSKSEEIIQNDTLKYFRHLGKAISKKSGGAVLFQFSKELELKAFGKIYCESLNEIYATKDQSWQIGQIIQTPLFTKYQFGFGKNKGLKYSFSEELEEQISYLQNDNISNKGAIHKRIIRYYNHEKGYDCVYLIKPNSKRYWLKSIALRDADDTFMDLKKTGL